MYSLYVNAEPKRGHVAWRSVITPFYAGSRLCTFLTRVKSCNAAIAWSMPQMDSYYVLQTKYKKMIV
jgi:hypothetical protein